MHAFTLHFKVDEFCQNREFTIEYKLIKLVKLLVCHFPRTTVIILGVVEII